MAFRLIFLLTLSNLSYGNLKLNDIDNLRLLTAPDSLSIIKTGTDFCNDFFQKNKNLDIQQNKFKNFFICKFSTKRNRFYIYMLAVDKDYSLTLKENCINIIRKWPWILDHIDERYNVQKKEYLDGFYIDNVFNDEILSFTKNIALDEQRLNNQISKLILQNRENFSNDNSKNNLFVEEQINKLNRVYKKIVNEEITDLDKVIKSQLAKITRYKVFINDLKKSKSYSCTWSPEKGLNPYVKVEKFNEFDQI